MFQIAILLKDQEFTRIVQAELSRRYQVNSVIKKDAEDLLSVLSIIPFNLVLCNEKIGNDSTAFRICNYIQSNAIETQVLTLGHKSSGLKQEIAVNESADPKKLAHKVAFLIGASTEDIDDLQPEKINIPVPENPKKAEVTSDEEKTTVFRLPQIKKKILPAEEYCPFHIKYFLHLIPDQILPFAVYGRIKKNDEFVYSQKLAPGWKNTKEVQRQFELRTGKELFVTEKDFDVANQILTESFLSLFTNPQITAMDRLTLNSDGYEFLLDIFKQESFNKYSVEIIKEMIKSLDKSIKVSDPMALFFQGLAAKKMSYAYSHIHMTCVLIFKFIDSFPWSKDQSKNKIIYLSLFHDLCLHNERNIRSHHRYNQEKSRLPDEIRNLMLNHADTIGNHLEKLVKAPRELTILIREHHGVKSGKGFLENPSLSISPLAMAFIVVEDFVTSYLETMEKSGKEVTPSDLTNIILQLKSHYTQLTYKEVVEQLQKIFNVPN